MRMIQYMLRIILFFPLFALNLELCVAEEAIVLPELTVNATRLARSQKTMSASSLILSEADLKNNPDLFSALQGQAGVLALRNGGPGQPTGILLRGNNAEHTLVVLDGVVVNDPLNPSRSFDFANLPVHQIESIEILKGPQSVLYGAEALGGVILIRTKKGTAQRSAHFEAGSYGSFATQLQAEGFQGSYSQTDGFSAANARAGNQERDGSRQYSLGGKKQFPVGEAGILEAQAFLSDTKTDTDSRGGPGGDSRNTFARNSLLQSALHYKILPDSSRWQRELQGQYARSEREDNTGGSFFFKGDRKKLAFLQKYQGQQEINQNSSWQNILELEEESGHSSEFAKKQKLQQWGAALEWHKSWGVIDSELGLRLHRNSRFGHRLSYRAGASYWLKPESSRFKLNFASGYKAPSLYQIYSRYGSISLKPERSVALDLAWEGTRSFAKGRLQQEIAIFYSRNQDLIDFNLVNFQYQNIASAKLYGVESQQQWEKNAFRLIHSLTYSRSLDQIRKQELLRRPRWQNKIVARYQFHPKWSSQLESNYVGKRFDVEPVRFTRQEMPPHALWNLQMEYAVLKQRLRFRLENIFDRRYENISGYGTAERSVSLAYTQDL